MTMGTALYTVIMGLLAFIGLVLASRAGDEGFAIFAYALLAFGLINVFVSIHRMTGTPKG